MARAVAKKKNQLPAVPSYLQDYAGQGATASADELALPFIRIVEALSPQMKKSDPAYSKDAEVGDIVNTVTQELWNGEEGIAIIPCFKRFEYPMFKVREARQGGEAGFLGMGDAQMFNQQSMRDEMGRDVLKNDPSVGIIQTGTMYSYQLDIETGMISPGVIGCALTRLKAWKEWVTQISMLRVPGPKGLFQPPIFGVVWTMRTQMKSNNDGEWHVPVFRPHPPVKGLIGSIGGKFASLLLNSDIAMQAKNLADSIEQGSVRGNYEAEEAVPQHDPETGEILDSDDDSPI